MATPSPGTRLPPEESAFLQRALALRVLLDSNGRALQLLADLEADLNHLHFLDPRIRRPIERLLDETTLMAQELNLLERDRSQVLYDLLEGVRDRIGEAFRRPAPPQSLPLCVRFTDAEALDATLCGGKAAELATLRQYLSSAIPDGFVLTTAASHRVLDGSSLSERIRLLLSDLDVMKDTDQFRLRTEAIRKLILASPLPWEVTAALESAVKRMSPAIKRWAVRSSAAHEGGRYSFAGQYDTLLSVEGTGLEAAYRSVLAGRYTDRAVLYRLQSGLTEVETSMAVLFMPMLEARIAGVLYTRDPRGAEGMLVTLVRGSAEGLARGRTTGETFLITRPGATAELTPVGTDALRPLSVDERLVLEQASALGAQAASIVNHDLDIEWLLDTSGHLWLLQARALLDGTPEYGTEIETESSSAFSESGMTIFPGRSEGQVVAYEGAATLSVPKGAILLSEEATPELAPLLPSLGGLLVRGGSPTGHLATLVREFAVPTLFQLRAPPRWLKPGGLVSLDATRRRIYRGARWPGMRERVLARLATSHRQPRSGPLYESILALNLTDPFSRGFAASRCKSVHDVIRFTHERAVRAMFELGDEQRSLFRRSRGKRLLVGFPLKVYLLGLEAGILPEKAEIRPEEVDSRLFEAFWAGFSDPALPWRERWSQEMRGLPSDFQEAVLGGGAGPRRPRDANYLVLGRGYLNFNARFSYHYAMLDAVSGVGEQNSSVHLRFHNGGASLEQRTRRALFMERTLRQIGFSVDRRVDLVNAWYRHHPTRDLLEVLRTLGRLLVCARELDLLMRTDGDVERFTTHFLEGELNAFAREG